MVANINTKLINAYLMINNLTEKEFCKKAGIDFKIYKEIMNGQLNLISLFRMAEFMKIDVTYLVLDYYEK